MPTIVHVTFSPRPRCPSTHFSYLTSLNLCDKSTVFVALEWPLLQTQTTAHKRATCMSKGIFCAYPNVPELYEIIEESGPGPGKALGKSSEKVVETSARGRGPVFVVSIEIGSHPHLMNEAKESEGKDDFDRNNVAMIMEMKQTQ
jgi:hypothetical protein